MVKSAKLRDDAAAVAVLFSPAMVPVIDIFRALGDFEDHYDVLALDGLERRLARTMSREAAKGIVSDALLLAFGLRRERVEPIPYGALHTRRGTLDEYCLVALIGAASRNDLALAGEAATALGAAHPQPLVCLAVDIARRLEAAGVTLEAPDRRLFAPADADAPVEVARAPDPRPLKTQVDL
jgi:hypothetical protein